MELKDNRWNHNRVMGGLGLIREEIKKAMTPRTILLFQDEMEKEEWRKNVIQNPVYLQFLQEIKEEGDRLLKESDPQLTYTLFRIFDDTGSRQEYEKVYFEKRRRLNTFAIMLLLQPENAAYREALENAIWSICNEYTWCLPAHLISGEDTVKSMDVRDKNLLHQEMTIDLFAAETAFALSEILNLIDHNLDRKICKRIYEEISRRIFIPYLHQEPFGWESAAHNWAAVCAGSIGAAALYLIDDPESLSTVLERVLLTMDYYLTGFKEDGICLEGYGYWQYGYGYYVYFADLLKTKSAGVLDLFKSPKVKEIAFFEQKSFLFRNQLVNFSDSLPTADVFLGLSHYLSKVYPDFEAPERSLGSSYSDDHCSRWGPAIRNLVWFDEHLKGKPWKAATIFSEKSQWFISRHHSKNGQFSFAAKGGHNDEPHNHNDIGQFILQGNGQTFFMDMGSGLYNKDYFGNKRYTFLCNGSQGHSVPSINGQGQTEGAESLASIKNVLLEDRIEVFELELAKAYRVEELQSLIRKFTWTKESMPALVLEDCYSFKKKPESIVERLITPVLKLTENDEGLILEGMARLKVQYNRELLSLAAKKLSFVNHFGAEEELLALDFHIKNPGKETVTKLVFQFD